MRNLAAGGVDDAGPLLSFIRSSRRGCNGGGVMEQAVDHRYRAANSSLNRGLLGGRTCGGDGDASFGVALGDQLKEKGSGSSERSRLCPAPPTSQEGAGNHTALKDAG